MKRRSVVRRRVAKTDPRASPRDARDVPALVAEGARRFNAGKFWDAHETWEDAWHALRAAKRPEDAAFLQGLILATAALENLRRGKPTGFRRQMAEALVRLRARGGTGGRVGVADDAAFADALLEFYLDAARRTRLAGLSDVGGAVPILRTF